MGRMGDLSQWSKHRREILRRLRLFNSDPNCNGNRNSHGDCDCYAKTYTDGHKHGDSHGNAHSNNVAHTKADIYTATFSDTEGSTDSPASAMSVTSLIKPSADFQRRFLQLRAH